MKVALKENPYPQSGIFITLPANFNRVLYLLDYKLRIKVSVFVNIVLAFSISCSAV